MARHCGLLNPALAGFWSHLAANHCVARHPKNLSDLAVKVRSSSTRDWPALTLTIYRRLPAPPRAQLP